MTQKEQDFENYKPMCCNEGWERVSRANYRCTKCDKDVTMEVVLLGQAIFN